MKYTILYTYIYQPCFSLPLDDNISVEHCGRKDWNYSFAIKITDFLWSEVLTKAEGGIKKAYRSDYFLYQIDLCYLWMVSDPIILVMEQMVKHCPITGPCLIFLPAKSNDVYCVWDTTSLLMITIHTIQTLHTIKTLKGNSLYFILCNFLFSHIFRSVCL